MRDKIERSSSTPSAAEVLRGLPFLAFLAGLFVLASVYGDDLRSLLQSSEWWAGAFAGAVTVFSAVVATLFVKRILSRWELLPPQLGQPSLRTPVWARCFFGAADSIAAVAYVVSAATFVIGFEQVSPLVWPFAIAVMITAIVLGAGLRWLAHRRGWEWRAKAG